MKNNNQVILITGSSSGIGAGIASYFGKRNYTVFVTYLKRRDEAQKVANYVEKHGGKATVSQLNVMDEASVKKVFETVKKECGKLDVLVNNAAVDFVTPIDSASFKDWKTITRTKIDGNFLCTKYALPLLKKSSDGNLIIIASSLGDKPDPEDAAYSVGTAGTVCFAKAMVIALAKYKIRTNVVCPGETRTNNQYWKDLGDTDAMWKKFAKENPLGRVSTPKDIAAVIYNLVHDETKFLNGNIVYVNGGGHLK